MLNAQDIIRRFKAKKQQAASEATPTVDIGSTIPFDATASQRDTVAQIGQDKINERGRLALAFIETQGRHGATPHEVAAGLGLGINQVRPVTTRLHQRGYIHRTKHTRLTPDGKPSNVYMCLKHWTPDDGEVPSRAHRGVGQEVVPGVAHDTDEEE